MGQSTDGLGYAWPLNPSAPIGLLRHGRYMRPAARKAQAQQVVVEGDGQQGVMQGGTMDPGAGYWDDSRKVQ